MGIYNHKSKNKIKKRKSTIKISSFINESISCPFCSKLFTSNLNYSQLNEHLKTCGKSYIETNTNCDIYSPEKDSELNKLIFTENEKLKLRGKIEDNDNFRFLDFNSKIEQFKTYIQSKKVSWQDGFCQLDLNRQNFLAESMNQMEKIDIFKELKINFIGEISYDAGGIIREWFTLIFKELEGKKLQLFIESESNDFSYIINPFLIHNDKNYKYFSFIGKLIAKALLDNIIINVCFNKLIYKILLKEEIKFEDLVFIDNPLYNSIKIFKENLTNENLENEELFLFYNVEMKDTLNRIHSLELIKGGKNILVVDFEDYIKKRIEFMIGIYEPFIKIIRESLFNIIPEKEILRFTSDEFELLLNGRPFIDVEEWKQFTQYKEPYNENHQIIKWFWDLLFQLPQKELSNLLIFSTGSARVPLEGFSALESNRGNIAKFTIQPISYINGRKNFIKAHTCFNRLDLPVFMSKEELKEAVLFICKNEIIGFGID